MGPRNQMNLASRPQNRHELKFTRHKFKGNNHSAVSLLPDAGVGKTALGGGHLNDEHQDDDEGGDAVPDQADLEHVAVTLGTNHVAHPEQRKKFSIKHMMSER